MKIKFFLLYVLMTHFQISASECCPSWSLFNDESDAEPFLPSGAGEMTKTCIRVIYRISELVYILSNLGYIITVFSLNNVKSNLPYCDNNMYNTTINTVTPVTTSCTTGQTCLPSNYINPSSCTSTSCPTGQSCLAPCPTGCQLGQVCPSNYIDPSTCPSTAACTTGQTCLPTNYISPSSCSIPSCTTGQQCSPSNYIDPSTCPSTAACTTGQQCFPSNYISPSTCPASSGCATGQQCSPSNYIDPSTCPSTAACTTGQQCFPSNYINPSTCPVGCQSGQVCPSNYIDPSNCPTTPPVVYEIVSTLNNPYTCCVGQNPGNLLVSNNNGNDCAMTWGSCCIDPDPLQPLLYPYLYCPITDISSGNIPSCSACSTTFTGLNEQLPCNQITAPSTLYCPSSSSAYSSCSFNPNGGSVTYQACPVSVSGSTVPMPTTGLCCKTGATCGNTYNYGCVLSDAEICPYAGYSQIECCNVPVGGTYVQNSINTNNYCCLSGTTCALGNCIPQSVLPGSVCGGSYPVSLQCCFGAETQAINGPFAKPLTSDSFSPLFSESPASSILVYPTTFSMNNFPNHSLTTSTTTVTSTPCEMNNFYGNFYQSIYMIFFFLPLILTIIYNCMSSNKGNSSHQRNIAVVSIILNIAIAAINLSSFITLVSNGSNNIATFWYLSTNVLSGNAGWVTAIEVFSMINTVIAVFYIIVNIIGLCKQA